MTDNNSKQQPDNPPKNQGENASDATSSRPKEVGGRKGGLDPTRYGDWEKNGRCIDF
ncbi:DUF1674 domain-containing protein [Marinicella sediminis]|uniref:DUF1674 domain-containing protein n=1 Tax=Marinicella sediminis TaxID=1792834 RepID=A0ABV7JCP0_9GAMM|nr:DUF1674 domain-containing protein [Marinicella sediminis]